TLQELRKARQRLQRGEFPAPSSLMSREEVSAAVEIATRDYEMAVTSAREYHQRSQGNPVDNAGLAVTAGTMQSAGFHSVASGFDPFSRSEDDELVEAALKEGVSQMSTIESDAGGTVADEDFEMGPERSMSASRQEGFHRDDVSSDSVLSSSSASGYE